MIMNQHTVCVEAPRLGLVVAIATGDGTVVGTLSYNRSADGAADIVAALAAPGLYKVEALTPDGEALLSLF